MLMMLGGCWSGTTGAADAPAAGGRLLERGNKAQLMFMMFVDGCWAGPEETCARLCSCCSLVHTLAHLMLVGGC